MGKNAVECLSVTAVSDDEKRKSLETASKALAERLLRQVDPKPVSFLPFHSNLFVCQGFIYLQFSGFEDSKKQNGQGGTQTREGHVEDAKG